nr:hypothetical protein [uncultured Cohaesibacter sp.]
MTEENSTTLIANSLRSATPKPSVRDRKIGKLTKGFMMAKNTPNILTMVKEVMAGSVCGLAHGDGANRTAS